MHLLNAAASIFIALNTESKVIPIRNHELAMWSINLINIMNIDLLQFKIIIHYLI